MHGNMMTPIAYQFFFGSTLVLFVIHLFLLQVGPVRSFRTSENAFIVNTLIPCQAYWITTTAINCGSSIRSQAAFIDVNDPMEFTAVISLGKNGPCSTWITQNLDLKHMDAQNFVIETLNDACTYSVPCTVNNTFKCQPGDETKVNFM